MARTEGIRAMSRSGFKVVSPSDEYVRRTRNPGKGTTNERRRKTIGKTRNGKRKSGRKKTKKSSGSRNATGKKRSGRRRKNATTGPSNRNRNRRNRSGNRTPGAPERRSGTSSRVL